MRCGVWVLFATMTLFDPGVSWDPVDKSTAWKYDSLFLPQRYVDSPHEVENADWREDRLADQVELERRTAEVAEVADMASRAEEEYERIKYDEAEDVPAGEAAEGEALQQQKDSETGANKVMQQEVTSEHKRNDAVAMGPQENCDDGQYMLEKDWDPYDPANKKDYTCTGPTLKPKHQKRYNIFCEKTRKPSHYCMNHKLTPSRHPPLSGSHRPVWARYGEYKYLPWQRWLHNMEHGALVFLYNKCADPHDVRKFAMMVRGCLRRHIITPYDLPKDKPFALVTWGCMLRMTHFNKEDAFHFIREYSLHGRENGVAMNGLYRALLSHPAHVVSDMKESDICPKRTFSQLRAYEAKHPQSDRHVHPVHVSKQPAVSVHKKNAYIHNTELNKLSHAPDTLQQRRRRTIDDEEAERQERGEIAMETRSLVETLNNMEEELDRREKEVAQSAETVQREADVARLKRDLDQVKYLFHTKLEAHLQE